MSLWYEFCNTVWYLGTIMASVISFTLLFGFVQTLCDCEGTILGMVIDLRKQYPGYHLETKSLIFKVYAASISGIMILVCSPILFLDPAYFIPFYLMCTILFLSADKLISDMKHEGDVQ